MNSSTIAIAGAKIKFEQIEAIIFDKDGTLEDSRHFLQQLAIERANLISKRVWGIRELLLATFGIKENQLDPTGLMAVGSREENEIAAAACIAQTGLSWFEARELARSAFTEATATKNTLTAPIFDGCRETLARLHTAGLKIGILSADSTVEVERFVDRYDLSEYIQLKMGSDRGLSKPDPKLYLQACRALDVEPQFTLMVGDARGDLEMAKAAGARAIGIYQSNFPKIYLDNADVAIANLKQIEILTSTG